MSAHKPIHFPSTRAEVLEGANAFAPSMGMHYAKERNRVVPGHPFVSRLSPAIRVRLVSEREVAQIALDEHGALHACEKFVQEVNWRGYWRSWLELHPEIWTRYQETRAQSLEGLAKVQRRRIEQIEAGESGCEPMDNFARELVETGYMHNHARMWFAAYWIHTEKLPWELGSDFFERHLLCACPASNTLSWRWVAGIQTRGKAYLARRSNLEKYCDPAYLGDEIGMERLEKPTEAQIEDAPLPNVKQPSFDLKVDGRKTHLGLWITEDDLSPETSELLNDLKFEALCTSVVGAPEKSPTSNGLRRSYRLSAAQDAGQRAHKQWDADCANLEANTGADLAERISVWAKTAGVHTVVSLKPFVGPTSDTLDAVRSRLDKEGIGLELLRRPEDAAMLKYGTTGFFKYWQGAKKELFAHP